VAAVSTALPVASTAIRIATNHIRRPLRVTGFVTRLAGRTACSSAMVSPLADATGKLAQYASSSPT
jgi:hypothetical protein